MSILETKPKRFFARPTELCEPEAIVASISGESSAHIVADCLNKIPGDRVSLEWVAARDVKSEWCVVDSQPAGATS